MSDSDTAANDPGNQPRRFHLGDILTLTTGCMVSPRLMDGVRELISHMCGGPVFTNQLGEALEACEPALLDQHKQLAGIRLPDLAAPPGSAALAAEIGAWLARLVEDHGEYLDVAPLPDGAFQRWGNAEAAEDMADRLGAENVYVGDPGSAAEIAGLIKDKRDAR